jgi:V8-like Glu-specific endopeptidase
MPKLPAPDFKILHEALTDTSEFETVRGRRTLIRNALSGYPQSGEIEKALRFVDWEGSPFVVAYDILDKLNGQEPSPGVPALALIAQAIQPLVTSEKFTALLRRQHWGDPASLAAQEWRIQRPAEELERIIGENTLKPLYFLRRALAAADAVVRVDLAGVAKASGFLAAPDLLITNHHVIADQEQARNAQANFFLEATDEKETGLPPRNVHVTSTAGADPLLYTNPDLDVSIVRLLDPPKLQRYLPLRPIQIKPDSRVIVIQHPGGFPKQISLQNNTVAFADRRIVQYYTSTSAGSSGSPVLDEDEFRVVAIHYRWVHNAAWPGGPYRNQGTSSIALLEDLRQKAPKLAEELTAPAS